MRFQNSPGFAIDGICFSPLQERKSGAPRQRRHSVIGA